MSDELVVKHCSPTLAGLKTGNLFTVRCRGGDEVRKGLRRLNKHLVPKGLRALPLRYADSYAVIYVYRPSSLRADFTDGDCRAILEERGYSCGNPERCVGQLAARLKAGGEFPHEIGLFLGYPPEDVRGFIEHRGEGFYCSGCWKVYGDVGRAETLFQKYKKCTEAYWNQWKRGLSVERLIVAATPKRKRKVGNEG